MSSWRTPRCGQPQLWRQWLTGPRGIVALAAPAIVALALAGPVSASVAVARPEAPVADTASTPDRDERGLPVAERARLLAGGGCLAQCDADR
jgi:hypothetical protein